MHITTALETYAREVRQFAEFFFDCRRLTLGSVDNTRGFR